MSIYASNEDVVNEIRKTGDPDRRLTLQLWKDNAGIIQKVCKKFKGYIEKEDAEQECFEPFVKAIQEYDTTAGGKFATYCYNRCFWHLQRYIEESGLLIRIPTYQQALIRQYRKVTQDYYKEYGEQPTDFYVCHKLGISQGQLEQLRKDERKTSIRDLDAPITEDATETIGDLIPDDSKDIEEEALKAMYKAQRTRAVWEAVNSLKPQEGQAIRLYYRDGKTYAEAGEIMGVSLQRVRVVMASGIRQLRTKERYRVLREFIDLSPIYSTGLKGGLGTFNRTWTSSTEYAAMKEIRREKLEAYRADNAQDAPRGAQGL